jgi:hypothetical protein
LGWIIQVGFTIFRLSGLRFNKLLQAYILLNE